MGSMIGSPSAKQFESYDITAPKKNGPHHLDAGRNAISKAAKD
jgi:hypothetical protein